MHIDLDRKSGIPLTEQIRQSIADRIRCGLLAPGVRLPSVRKLAAELAVSLVTAVQAYERLEQDGLIIRQQGRGTYVYQDGTEAEGEAQTDWQLSIMDYVPRARFWQHHHLQASVVPSVQLKLSAAEINRELFPIGEMAEELYRLIQKEPWIISEYGPIQGDAQLRGEIAGYLQRHHGIRVTQEEMLVTNGSQQGIDIVARTFVGPGDVVAVEAPTYMAAIDVFRGRGATILSVPVDEDGMRVDLLTAMCDVRPPKLIYTTPSFHNPTGSVLSMRRRKQLLDLAQSYNCLIAEDDAFSDMYFSQAPPPSLKSMDQSGHVIYLKSFSKLLSPGARVAIAAATGSVLTRLVSSKAITDLGTPLLTQKAMLPFFQNGRIEAHLVRMRARLYEKRNIVLNTLKRYAPPGVTWTKPMGGLNLWVSVPMRIQTDIVLGEALRRGVTFLPGSVFYAGEPENHHLRIVFSYLPDDQLQEAVQILCEVLAQAIEQKTEEYRINPLV